jgi:hypothetical protein
MIIRVRFQIAQSIIGSTCHIDGRIVLEKPIIKYIVHLIRERFQFFVYRESLDTATRSRPTNADKDPRRYQPYHFDILQKR